MRPGPAVHPKTPSAFRSRLAWDGLGGELDGSLRVVVASRRLQVSEAEEDVGGQQVGKEQRVGSGRDDLCGRVGDSSRPSATIAPYQADS